MTIRSCGPHLYEVVKEADVDALGEGVACVGRLLEVHRHLDRFRLAAPLAVHRPADELTLEVVDGDAEQVGGVGQHCKRGAR